MDREGVNASPTIPGPEMNRVGLTIRVDADHAAASAQRCRYIQVAIDVESEPWGRPSAAIESLHFAGRSAAIHRVETRGRGPGDVQVAVGSERQVISGDGWLERREHVDLALRG